MIPPAWEDVEESFRSSIVRFAGDEAHSWLASLPHLESEVCARWRLVPGNELRGGRLALVRLVRRADGNDAVLKLAGPWDRPVDEIASLRAWDAGPAPRLLEADASLGAMLLERVTPGVRPVDAHAADVATLLTRLHLAPPAGVPPLGEIVHHRLERAEKEHRASPQKLAWARDALSRLVTDGPAAVLVHGDFDERNLLTCARRGVCAIDPLPCAGDGTYDAAFWVHANRRRGRRGRFDAMVALGLERDRLRDWCAVIAVHG